MAHHASGLWQLSVNSTAPDPENEPWGRATHRGRRGGCKWQPPKPGHLPWPCWGQTSSGDATKGGGVGGGWERFLSGSDVGRVGTRHLPVLLASVSQAAQGGPVQPTWGTLAKGLHPLSGWPGSPSLLLRNGHQGPQCLIGKTEAPSPLQLRANGTSQSEPLAGGPWAKFSPQMGLSGLQNGGF